MPGLTVLAAPNAFKGALEAAPAALAMARGVAAAVPGAHVRQVPVADGGDGTAAVLSAALGGRLQAVRTAGAWGQPGLARYAMLPGRLAVVDLAAASGLGRRRPSPQQALSATSAGTGRIALHALSAGAERIWLALGGSACTDGGAGLLAALGARLLDARGRDLPPGGAALRDLARIDLAGLRGASAVEWSVLVDVGSPLLGAGGAAAVFSPQKGAGAAEAAALEEGLLRFADVLEAATGRRARDLPGAGAAGGCGFGLAAGLAAAIRPGAEAVAAAVDLAGRLEGCDLVLTGEGTLDAQTASGKAPAVVARLAGAAGVPAVALAGVLGPGWARLLRPEGPLAAALALPPGPRSRRSALAATGADLARTAGAAAALFAAGRAPRGTA